jgi:hypothetical protein
LAFGAGLHARLQRTPLGRAVLRRYRAWRFGRLRRRVLRRGMRIRLHKRRRPTPPPQPVQPPFNPGRPGGHNPPGSPVMTGPGMGNNPFTPVIEEWQRVVANWMPHNADDEASFQAVRIMLNGLPELLEAVSNGCRTLAGKSQDNVLFKQGAADLLNETAEYVGRAVPALQQVAAGIDAIHQDDVERIQSGDPRVAAMDWDRNQRF